MPIREALGNIAHDFYSRGWMAGTAGNLSAICKDEPDCFWITSSGLPKGQLGENDFILINTRSNELIGCELHQRFVRRMVQLGPLPQFW